MKSHPQQGGCERHVLRSRVANHRRRRDPIGYRTLDREATRAERPWVISRKALSVVGSLRLAASILGTNTRMSGGCQLVV